MNRCCVSCGLMVSRAIINPDMVVWAREYAGFTYKTERLSTKMI